MRYEALNDAALFEGQSELQVRVSFDKEAKTLTIFDNGIGMSQQEAIDHLGTIAKSGTREFMGKLSGDQKTDAKDQGALIGQFGVGFYSGYIVADRITVESRRAGLKAEEGVRWSSTGTGEFEVETITQAQRGTTIILHMRDDADEYLSLGNSNLSSTNTQTIFLCRFACAKKYGKKVKRNNLVRWW